MMAAFRVKTVPRLAMRRIATEDRTPFRSIRPAHAGAEDRAVQRHSCRRRRKTRASDCIIRDINARGAAISLAKTLPTGAQTILLDTGNRTAHFARVVWSHTGRFGLLFVRSYKMNSALPPRLVFLWRLLLEANLRQAERAVAAGVPAELALTSIGVTREHILQTARYARTDTKLRQLLETAWCQLDEQPYSDTTGPA